DHRVVGQCPKQVLVVHQRVVLALIAGVSVGQAGEPVVGPDRAVTHPAKVAQHRDGGLQVLIELIGHLWCPRVSGNQPKSWAAALRCWPNMSDQPSGSEVGMNVGSAQWRGRGAWTGAGSDTKRSRMSIWGRTVDTAFTACASSPVLTLIGLV